MRLQERLITSITAITHRASNLKLMSNNQQQYVFRQLASYRNREPLDDQIPREEPELINKQADLLDEHNAIKKKERAEIKSIPDKDFLSINGLTRDELK